MIKNLRILIGCIITLSIIPACTLSPSSDITADTLPVDPSVNTAVNLVTPLTLRGTEPFWSFNQTATGYAVYTIPGASSIEERYYTTTQVTIGTDIIITATPQNPADLPISAQVIPTSCNDGMSDTTYPYTVNFSYGITTFIGCGQ